MVSGEVDAQASIRGHPELKCAAQHSSPVLEKNSGKSFNSGGKSRLFTLKNKLGARNEGKSSTQLYNNTELKTTENEHISSKVCRTMSQVHTLRDTNHHILLQTVQPHCLAEEWYQ